MPCHCAWSTALCSLTKINHFVCPSSHLHHWIFHPKQMKTSTQLKTFPGTEGHHYMNRSIRNKPGNPFQERDIRQNKIASFAKGRNHTWHCSQPIRIQNRIRCSHELCYLCFQVHVHICSPKQSRNSGKPRRLHHSFKNSNRASCPIQVGGPIIGHILPWWLDWWKNPNVAITKQVEGRR